jgi:NADPH-dependent ferric siderophore reductase
MPTISVTHSDSGLVLTNVNRTTRVSPHIIRVTLAGGDLDRFEYKGFDQWFRLALPVRAENRFDNLPQRFGIGGLLKYLTLPKDTRPVLRNYTIRQFNRDSGELDIDFVVHGTQGVAGPWAAAVEPGTEVAFIDQGCGWAPVPAQRSLIVADESAMPAALGILRDIPRDSVGDAIIELFDERDRQDVDAPEGVNVRWVMREPDAAPGAAALPALRELMIRPSLYAFAVGESALATGARRYLVNERGIPKSDVTFCGYWRVGKASPS